jgi:hypothetical protein
MRCRDFSRVRRGRQKWGRGGRFAAHARACAVSDADTGSWIDTSAGRQPLTLEGRDCGYDATTGPLATVSKGQGRAGVTRLPLEGGMRQDDLPAALIRNCGRPVGEHWGFRGRALQRPSRNLPPASGLRNPLGCRRLSVRPQRWLGSARATPDPAPGRILPCVPGIWSWGSPRA